MTIFISSFTKAQVPTSYEFSLRNDVQISPTVFEFDIYLLNLDLVNVFELDLYQTGILVNPAIVNGGTITASIVAGSSQLVALQQPTTGITFASNCIKLANPTIVPHGFGTIIPTTSPGVRIATIQLTNTVPFGQFSPNLAFNFTPSPYNTGVYAYNQTSPFLGVNLTNPMYFNVSCLANKVLNSGPLPIELISFEGQYKNNEVELKWVTASETDNDYFTIQKSSDAANFEDAANIEGAGNSISYKYYSFIDEPYENKITYYRLKQTDFNGKYTYSKIISIDCSDVTNYFVSYNPALGNERKITINIYNNKAAKAIIKLYDISGKEIATLLDGEIINNGFHTYTYSFIRSGVYIVKAVINNTTQTNKIVFL